jgi:hypothetical protein
MKHIRTGENAITAEPSSGPTLRPFPSAVRGDPAVSLVCRGVTFIGAAVIAAPFLFR